MIKGFVRFGLMFSLVFFGLSAVKKEQAQAIVLAYTVSEMQKTQPGPVVFLYSVALIGVASYFVSIDPSFITGVIFLDAQLEKKEPLTPSKQKTKEWVYLLLNRYPHLGQDMSSTNSLAQLVAEEVELALAGDLKKIDFSNENVELQKRDFFIDDKNHFLNILNQSDFKESDKLELIRDFIKE